MLGQQVLMGRMNIPAPILMETIQPGSGVTVSQYAALVARARTNPASLTPAEQAILAQPSIPLQPGRLGTATRPRAKPYWPPRSLGKNLVVLSGDTHNALGQRTKTATVTPGCGVRHPSVTLARL